MNLKIKALSILLLATSIFAVQVIGAGVSNSTEHLVMTYDDVSFSMLTLTFAANQVELREKGPVPREVLRLGTGEVSLSLLRLLFFGSVYVDSFSVSDLYISLLKDTNSVYHLFNPAIPTNEIEQLKTGLVLPGTGSGSSEKDDKESEAGEAEEAESQEVQTMTIPNIQIKNVDIELYDLLTYEKLFTLDDIWFTMKDVYLPIQENKKVCSAAVHVGLNGDPDQYLHLDLAARAPRAFKSKAFLKTKVEARNISLLIMKHIVDIPSTPSTNTKEQIQFKGNLPSLIGAGDLFSNEWERVCTTLTSRTAELNTNEQLHAFLGIDPAEDVTLQAMMESPMVSNISFDVLLDVTVSNQVFYPGEFRVEFFNQTLLQSNLLFRYAITNTPELLVPWPRTDPADKNQYNDQNIRTDI